MKVTVLNGSPKGDISVTMQYVRYIRKRFPGHEYVVHDISHRIKKLERDDASFKEVIDDVSSSDVVLWAFPLYHMLVPSQYKRFIELVFEREVVEAFSDIHAAVLTTSIHFFDHTAHAYMHAICDDLGMRYVGFHSAEMSDLLEEKGRDQLVLFTEDLFDAIEHKRITSRANPPVNTVPWDYLPGAVTQTIDTKGKRIVVLTDGVEGNLGRMVERFTKSLARTVEVHDINDIPLKNGCLGCCNCGLDNECAQKDGFPDFYNEKVRTADVVVFAGKVTDRHLSSQWKKVFDRSFFHTHIPALMGKQFGWIVAGPLGQLPTLRATLEGEAELGRVNLVDIVTDESGDAKTVDALILSLAERLIRYSDSGYSGTRTFLGVGGDKLFRDFIYNSRFVFQADHAFYKKHGFYDFPQHEYSTRLLNTVMTGFTWIPAFKKEFKRRTKKEMIRPLERLIDE